MLTSKQVQRRRDTIQNKISLWENKLASLQNEECPHIQFENKAGSDTGNWCKQDDSYWYDYHCFDCGKMWRVPQ